MKNPLIGKMLKRYRENCGLTQLQVAKALNVDRSTYTYYETGTTTPSAQVIIKLSKIFNVPYTVFMNAFMDASDEAFADSGDGFGYFMGGGSAKEKIYDIPSSEQQLPVFFRSLTPEQKTELLDYASKLNEANSKKAKKEE